MECISNKIFGNDLAKLWIITISPCNDFKKASVLEEKDFMKILPQVILPKNKNSLQTTVYKELKKVTVNLKGVEPLTF
jgi:hypothetical protein